MFNYIYILSINSNYVFDEVLPLHLLPIIHMLAETSIIQFHVQHYIRINYIKAPMIIS